MAQEPECQRVPFQDTPDQEILDVIREVYSCLRQGGLKHGTAVDRLKAMEAFAGFLHLIDALDSTA